MAIHKGFAVPSDTLIDAQRECDAAHGHSTDYYLRMEEEFDQAALTQRKYKNQATMDLIQELWFRYCTLTRKSPIDTLKQFPIQVLNAFFAWMLHERRETLRCASTLQTYWNTFCLVRKRLTGCYTLDLETKSMMVGVRQRLVQEHGLSTTKKAKPIMRAEDEFKLLETLWSSPRMSFDHERLRVQLALLIQLAGITGNRPSALLGLRYGDIKISLLRDPKGGECPSLLIDLTFHHTKGYMGQKDANTFGIPTVPNESCLLLCPQIMLLSLVFADKAFASPSLVTPVQLFSLRVVKGLNEMTLPLKESLATLPIFRRLRRAVEGRVVSMEGATDNWFRSKLRQLGKVTGLKLPVGPYAFRRGNGEALDSSSQISDAQRNLILQHASSEVFQHNYLSHYITSDTQAVYRGLAPQDAIMRAASGMSRTIDMRRPIDLSATQLQAIRRHPEVVLLRRTRDRLKRRLRQEHVTISRAKGRPAYSKYVLACRAVHNRMKTVRKVILAAVITEYDTRQPIADIEAQLSKQSKAEHETSPSSVTVVYSEHRRKAINALLTFVSDGPIVESGRRASAVAAVSALSMRCEAPIPDICHPRIYEPPLPNAQVASPQFPLECSSTQCIFCMGNKAISYEKRVKTFYNRNALKKHFWRKHLRFIPDDKMVDCPHPFCNTTLKHKKHLQNHAATVHKTWT